MSLSVSLSLGGLILSERESERERKKKHQLKRSQRQLWSLAHLQLPHRSPHSAVMICRSPTIDRKMRPGKATKNQHYPTTHFWPQCTRGRINRCAVNRVQTPLPVRHGTAPGARRQGRLGPACTISPSFPCDKRSAQRQTAEIFSFSARSTTFFPTGRRFVWRFTIAHCVLL